jgi:hypothetical protein
MSMLIHYVLFEISCNPWGNEQKTKLAALTNHFFVAGVPPGASAALGSRVTTTARY